MLDAISKAKAAYPVLEPLKRAIVDSQQLPDYRDRCYNILSVTQSDIVIDGLDYLAKDFGLLPTQRTSRKVLNYER